MVQGCDVMSVQPFSGQIFPCLALKGQEEAQRAAGPVTQALVNRVLECQYDLAFVPGTLNRGHSSITSHIGPFALVGAGNGGQ